jgi:hypothetical protein
MLETNNYTDSARPVGNSFFFTEPDKILQRPDQAFGPFGETEEEKSQNFRLTSMFDVIQEGGTAKAFAICSGQILVQPHPDPNRINAIIKPLDQPFNGLNVKYFIYRGLLKSDFIEWDENFSDWMIKSSSNSSITPLITRLNIEFSNLQNPLDIGFLASYIGYSEHEDIGQITLDDLFMRRANLANLTDQSSYQAPLIIQGEYFGNYCFSECGIEIVIDYYGEDLDIFKLDINFARNQSSAISLNGVQNPYNLQLLRESVKQFIDITAYYGLHIDNGEIKLSTQQDPYTGISIPQFLDPFQTKRKWYLYIGSNHNRHYGFYDLIFADSDAAHNCKLDISNTGIVEQRFESFGWPLLIIDIIQDDYNEFGLDLQLKVSKDMSYNLFCHLGIIVMPIMSDTLNHINLGNSKDDEGNYSHYTNQFKLLSRQRTEEGAYQWSTISMLEFDGYQRNTPIEPYDGLVSDTYNTPFGVDFKIIDCQGLIDSTANFRFVNDAFHGYYTFRDDLFTCGKGSLLIDSNYLTRGNIDNELLRVTYLIQPRRKSGENGVISTPGVENIFGEILYDIVAGNSLKSEFLTLEYLDFVSFNHEDEPLFGAVVRRNGQGTSLGTSLGLTMNENQHLLFLVPSEFLNARITLIRINSMNSFEKATNGTVYYKYIAGFIGESAEGKLKLSIPEQSVEFYSLDNYFYFTKNYSSGLSELNSLTTENIFEL